MKESIRIAEKKDIPALCEIWKESFSDSDEYIRYFYSENFERIKVLVYDVDSKPVSAVNIIDAEFVNKNESRKAKYLYAGGTLLAHRKKGYFNALLKFIVETETMHGWGLFLKPASQKLTEYFVQLGFEIDSYFRFLTVSPGSFQPISALDISYSDYNRMRNKAYSNLPFVRWDDAHLCWCVKENEYYSGRTLKITIDQKDYFLMGYPEDKTLIINETNLSPDQIRQASRALCDLFGTEQIKAYMPDFSCKEGERILSSVVYNLPVRNTYTNLILI